MPKLLQTRPRAILLALACLGFFLLGMKVEEVPNPRVTQGLYVEDAGRALTPAQIQELDDIARELEGRTGIEMAIVTVDSLAGLPIEDFAERLFKRYGIGKKAADNGILILLSPKDRKVRIEVGYGLEAELTDSLSKRLIEQYGIPSFKKSQYAQGLLDLTRETALVIGGKPTQVGMPPASGTPRENGDLGAEPDAPQPDPVYVYSSEPGFFERWLQRSLRYIGPGIALAFGFFFIGRHFFQRALAARRESLRKTNVVLVSFGITHPLLNFFFEGMIGGWLWFFLAFGAPMLGIFGLAFLFRRRLAQYHLDCRGCGGTMQIVDETADDEYLSEEEQDEERAKGMDYEFWSCTGCATRERLEVKLGGAKACKKCGRRSLVYTSKVTSEATTSRSGTRRHDENCFNRKCKFSRTWTTKIPKKSSSSSSSSSGGGGGGGSSFGGGSSGGGGASGGW